MIVVIKARLMYKKSVASANHGQVLAPSLLAASLTGWS